MAESFENRANYITPLNKDEVKANNPNINIPENIKYKLDEKF
jgi:hypothetical protein